MNARRVNGVCGLYLETVLRRRYCKDFTHGDKRSILYLSGPLKGRRIVQHFKGTRATGGWVDQ